MENDAVSLQVSSRGVSHQILRRNRRSAAGKRKWSCGPQEQRKSLNRQGFSFQPDGCQPPVDSFDNRIDALPKVDLVGSWHFSRFGGRGTQFRWLESPISNCTDCRKPVSSQAIGVLPRARNSATTVDQRRPTLVGPLVPALFLEIRPIDRQARNLDRLASQGIPAVLEMEVATGQAADPAGLASTHCAYGSR
jgi:hypothetical protein